MKGICQSGSQLHHYFPFFASGAKRQPLSALLAGSVCSSFLRSDSGGVESDKFSSTPLPRSLAVWSSFLLPLACGWSVGRSVEGSRFWGTLSRGNF